MNPGDHSYKGSEYVIDFTNANKIQTTFFARCFEFKMIKIYSANLLMYQFEINIFYKDAVLLYIELYRNLGSNMWQFNTMIKLLINISRLLTLILKFINKYKQLCLINNKNARLVCMHACIHIIY